MKTLDYLSMYYLYYLRMYYYMNELGIFKVLKNTQIGVKCKQIKPYTIINRDCTFRARMTLEEI